MIEKYLKGNIRIENEIDNWKETIKLASEPILKSKKIEEKYVESMIENIEKLGFYIVLSEDIAMPHSRPECGVNETCLSFLKVNKPIKFGDYNIQLIFVLGAKDSSSHIDLLTELMQIFGDEEKIDKLKKALTIKEIEDILKGGNV